MNTIAVDKDLMKTLVETRNLLEELLETIDVLADEELMKAIRESEEEVKEGKTRDLKEFVTELGLEDEL